MERVQQLHFTQCGENTANRSMCDFWDTPWYENSGIRLSGKTVVGFWGSISAGLPLIICETKIPNPPSLCNFFIFVF